MLLHYPTKTSSRFRSLFAPVLVAAISFSLTQAAHAQSKEELLNSIVATGPLPCASESIKLLNLQATRTASISLVEGMRDDSRLGTRWAPGNRNYDKVQVIVAAAVAEDEKKNGPLFTLTIEGLLDDAFSSMTENQLRNIAAFFSNPAGKLYWSDVIDGADCKSDLEDLDGSPFPPLEGEPKERQLKLIVGLSGRHDHYVQAQRSLSSSDRANLKKYDAILDDALQNELSKSIQRMDSTISVRLKNILHAHAAEIHAAMPGGGYRTSSN